MLLFEGDQLGNFNVSGKFVNTSQVRDLLDSYLGADILPRNTEIVLIVAYSVLSVVSVISNLLIIGIICRSRKLIIPMNLLLISLMISDIGMCIVCMPFTVIMLTRRSWPFGSVACKVIPLVQGIFIHVSSLTIAVIALDRLYRVTQNKPTNRLSAYRFRFFVEIMMVWLIAIIFNLPVAYYQQEVHVGIVGIKTYIKCVENWPSTAKKVYTLSTVVIQLIVPSVSLIASYVKIKIHLKKNLTGLDKSGKLDATLSTSDDTASAKTGHTATIDLASARKRVERTMLMRELSRNSKVTCSLLRVAVAYALCWTPWNLFNLYLDFSAEIYLDLDYIYVILVFCHLVAMTTPTTNAILYGYFNPNIKSELQKLKAFLILKY